MEEVDNKETPNQNPNPWKQPKGKSCKGCVYYSSALHSKSRNPTCVGISKTLPKVPSYIEGKIEVETSKYGNKLKEFKVACVGYSVYPDKKDASYSVQHDKPAEFPYCIGIQWLRAVVEVERRDALSTANHLPADAHRREDGIASPQSRAYKPAHPSRDDYMTRFSRSANLVASGVAKNMNRVGHYVKGCINDILYPYRRPPK